MCCLKYEQEAYEDAVKRSPRNESFVETPDGVGTVTSVNLLRETVKVRLDDQPDNPRCYQNCEVCVVRSGKGKRPEGYVSPPPEELAKLRKVTPPPEDPILRLSAHLDSALSGLGIQTSAAPQEGAPAPEKEGQRRSRSRGRGRGGRQAAGEAPRGEDAQQQGQQPQQPRASRGDRPPRKPRDAQKTREAGQAAPPPEGAAPAGAGGAKKKPYRPRRRHRPKGDGGQKAPPAAE